MSNPRLYGVPGSGAMICEAAFALANIEIDIVDLTWSDVGWESKSLQHLNMLGQVPVLEFASGEVLTETNAILHWIHSQEPEIGLILSSENVGYVKFLRWLMFLNASVYPTFTYGDVPQRWVDNDPKASELLRQGTENHRKTLFEYMEKDASTPYFMGDKLCAIDLYLWMMCHWSPGEEWFQRACPNIFATRTNIEKISEVITVTARNFPEEKHLSKSH